MRRSGSLRSDCAGSFGMCPTAGRAPPRPRRQKARRRAVDRDQPARSSLAVGVYLVVRSLAPVIGPVLIGSGCSAAAHAPVGAARYAAGQHRGHDRGRGAPAVDAPGGGHHCLRDGDAGIQAARPDLRDLDSVGVFQQRPSQGWGPARKLENPVYATTKFFRALKAVHGYQTMPVYQAAQAVQHSADGSAYIQYERMAAEMAGAFTGQRGHAVYCWSDRGEPAPPRRGRHHRGAGQHLRPGHRGTGPDRRRATPCRCGSGTPSSAGTVASWLVTHASKYGIHQVRFGGYQWRAAAGTQGLGA